MATSHSMRGCSCRECEAARVAGRKYQQRKRDSQRGEEIAAEPIKVEPLKHVSMGDHCLACRKLEAHCARDGGCCERCTHTFGEPGIRNYICKECNQVGTATNATGCLPKRHPLCDAYYRAGIKVAS